jgi:hypothetical protein
MNRRSRRLAPTFGASPGKTSGSCTDSTSSTLFILTSRGQPLVLAEP